MPIAKKSVQLKNKTVGGNINLYPITDTRVVYHQGMLLSDIIEYIANDYYVKEYIFKRAEDIPEIPDSSGIGYVHGIPVMYDDTLDDWVPEGWLSYQEGVDENHPNEWACYRVKVRGSRHWSEFMGTRAGGSDDQPLLYNHFGERGLDGKGVEYVYVRTSVNIAPVVFGDDEGYVDTNYRGFDEDDHLPRVCISDIYAGMISGNGSEHVIDDVVWVECTDEPVGVTREWLYEWVLVRNNNTIGEFGGRHWMPYLGSTSLWSTYSKNTVRLDVDNEMDSVYTDSQGVVVNARTISTEVRLYDGDDEVQMNPNSLTTDGSVGAIAGGLGLVVSWSFAVGATISTMEKSIRYHYLNADYEHTVTITPSLGKPIYQLKPSHSSLPCERNADNTLTNPPALSISIAKIDNNSSLVITEIGEGGTVVSGTYTMYVRYSLSSMPSSKTDGAAWPTSNSVQASPANNNVFIALFNASGVLIDRETIPIIKDGANGESVVRVDLDNNNDTMLYSSAKGLISGQVISHAHLYEGSHEGTATWKIIDAVGVTLKNGGNPVNSDSSSFYNGATDAWITSTGIVYVNGITAKSATITVQGTYVDSGSRTHTATDVLTIKKILDGDKYDLIITPNAISYNSTTDIPATSTVEVQVWRMSCDGTYAMSAPPTGYATYVLDGNQQLMSSTDSSFMYTVDNSERGDLTIKISKGYTSIEFLDCETIPINKVENGRPGDPGADVVRIDLDNQMDVVSVDGEGKIRFDRTIVVNATIYKGGSIVTTGVTHDMSDSSLAIGECIPTFSADPGDAISGGVLTITWAFTKGMSCSSESKTISLIYDDITYTAVFSLGETQSDVIYQVQPSPSSVTFTYDNTNETYTPATVSLRCDYVKMTGSGTTVVTDASTYVIDSSNYLYYRIKETNNWGSWLNYGGALNATTSHKEFEFCISSSSSAANVADSNIIDREVVPVVKDGIKGIPGANSIRIDLDNQMDVVSIDSEGKVRFNRTVVVNAILYEGSHPVTSGVTTTMTAANLKIGDCTPTLVAPDSVNANGTATITWNFTKGTSCDSATKNISLVYNGISYSATFSLGITKSDAIFQVQPFPSVAAFSYDNSNNVYVPTDIPVRFDYVKITGSGTNVVTNVSSYAIDSNNYMYYRTRGTGNWGNWTMYTSAVSATTAYTELEFCISSTSIDASVADNNIIDREVVPVVKDGIKGANSIRIDLDNQMDVVSVNSEGKVRFDRTVVVNAKLYDGSSPITSDVSTTMTAAGLKIGDCTPTLSGPTNGVVTITWNFTTGNSCDITTKNITMSYGSLSYTAIFSLGVTKSDTIYQLHPYPSSASFAYDSANNAYTPSSVSLRCGYTKMTGSGTTVIDNPSSYAIDSSNYLYYRENASSTWGSWRKYTGAVSAVPTYKEYEFCISSESEDASVADNNIIDREVIPVVKDGIPGANNIRIDLDNQMDIVSVDSEGKVRFDRTIVVNATLYDGSDPITSGVTTTMTQSGLTIGDCTPTITGPTNGVVNITWNFTTSNTCDNTSKNITLIYNGITYVSIFSLGTIKSDTIYQLHPYPSAASFAYDNVNNTYTPASVSVRCGYIKMTGSGTTVTDNPSSYVIDSSNYLYYRTNINDVWGIWTKYTSAISAVSTSKEYEFCISSTSIDASVADNNIIDREIIPVVKDGVKGEDGKSSIRIDIDNETDIVSLDSDGKVRFAKTVVVHAKIYDGAGPAISGVTTTMTQAGLAIGGCTPTLVGPTNGEYTITWTFTKGMTCSATTKDISLTYASNTYTSIFTLGTTDSDVLYQIHPTPSVVSFSYDDANNTFVPSTINIKCGYTKMTGSGTSVVDDPSTYTIDSNNYLYYRSKTNNTWGAWSQYTSAGINASASGTITDYEFCISSNSAAGSVANTNIVDREVVPVVKDGVKGNPGDSVVRLDLDNETDLISLDSDGNVRFDRTIVVHAKLYRGGTPLTTGVTHSMIDSSLAIGGCTPTLSTNVGVEIPGGELTITWAFTKGMAAGQSSKNITLTHNSVSYTTVFSLGVSQSDVLYQLTPFPSVASFKYDNTNEQYTPASISLTCGYTKITGGGTFVEPAPSASMIDDNNYLYYRTQQSGTWNNWYAYSSNLSEQSSTQVSKYEFCISSASTAADVSVNNITDREVVPIVKDGIRGIAGHDAVRIDIDNEMDSVSVDSEGYIRFDKTVTIHAKLYRGANPIPSGVTTTMTAANLTIGDCTPTLVTPDSSGANGTATITWNFTTSDMCNATTKSIELTFGGTTYTAVFTLNTIKSDAIYQVQVSPSAVSFNFDSSNMVYTPASIALYSGYIKMTGSGTSVVDRPTTNTIDSIYYRYYRTKTSGVWSSWEQDSSSGIAVASTTTVTDYEFCISSESNETNVADSNIIDREVVPIVRDGIKGDRGMDALGIVIDLDNQVDLVSVDSNGYVRFARSVVVNAKLYSGGEPITLDVTNPNTSAGLTIGTCAPTLTFSNGSLKVQWDFTTSMTVSETSKTISLTYDGKTYDAVFTLGITKSQAIYQVLPSLSTVSFSYNSSTGSYTPSSVTVYVGCTIATGNGTTVNSSYYGSDIGNDYYLYYRYRDTSWSSWNSWSALTYVSISNSTTYTDYEFCISTANNPQNAADSNIIDREVVPIVKGGKDGEKGKDGKSPNPNLLYRTNFDLGMDYVKEAWYGTISALEASDHQTGWNVQSIINGSYDGMSSMCIDSSAVPANPPQGQSNYREICQEGKGILEASEIYTLSFWSKSNGEFHTFIFGNTPGGSTAYATSSSYKYIVDGVKNTSSVPSDGKQAWGSSSNTWVYHTFTFKAAATLSMAHISIVFRAPHGVTLNFCMPKLERGDTATGYVMHMSESGQNAMFMNLDNPTDMLSLDSTGDSLFDRNITVHASVYEGGKKITSGVTCLDSSTSLQIGPRKPSITTSNGVVTITWSFQKGDTVSSTNKTISLSCNNLTYSSVFSLCVTQQSAIFQVNPAMSEVVFTYSSTQGKYLPDNTIKIDCGYVKYTGSGSISADAQGVYVSTNPYYYLLHRRKNIDGTWTNWCQYSTTTTALIDQRTVSAYSPYSGIEFVISSSITVTDSTIIDRAFVPIIKTGTPGKTGPMYYPAGEYNNSTAYTRTDDLCPFVMYTVNNETKYYYLKQNSQGNAPTDASYWGEAPQYEMLITKALFTSFASLGSFIVSGDWFISRYGKLYGKSTSASGTVDISGSNIETPFYGVNGIPTTSGGSGKPAYCWFDGTDPTVENRPSTNTDLKFAPTLAIDALTGRFIANNGTFAGELSAATGTFTGTLEAAGGVFKGGIRSPYINVAGDETKTLSLPNESNVLSYILPGESQSITVPEATESTNGLEVRISRQFTGSDNTGHLTVYVNGFVVYQDTGVRYDGATISVKAGQEVILRARNRYEWGGSTRSEWLFVNSIDYNNRVYKTSTAYQDRLDDFANTFYPSFTYYAYWDALGRIIYNYLNRQTFLNNTYSVWS